MKGTNVRRPPDKNEDGTLWVQEVFASIQGEGPNSGERAVFVRFAGCNLRCRWCDTEFDSSDWHPTHRALADAIHKVSWGPGTLVVITGGEPLRQEIGPFCRLLLHEGLRVQIETSGSIWPSRGIPVHRGLEIVVSPKTPKVHKEITARAIAWKYVIESGSVDPVDGLPTASPTALGLGVAGPPEGSRIYVIPCDEGQEDKNHHNATATVVSVIRHGYRLGVQMHKVVGIP